MEIFESNIYKFLKPCGKYSELFLKEKNKILQILGNNAIIKHIGSTSVKDLGGKGIIDMLIGVNKNMLKFSKNKMIDKEYLFSEKASTDSRLFFKKYYDGKGGRKRFHVHLTFKNEEDHFLALLFRDRLRASEELCRDYECVKKKAIKFSKGDGEKYRKYKEGFIRKVIEEAPMKK